MKTDAAELRTFLTDELGENSNLEGKSKGYLELKTQMELEDKLPSDMDTEDVTADFLRGWKAHKKALEDGKLAMDSGKPDTSLDEMPEHIKRKRDRATDENWLSGEGDTIRQKAIKQVARDDGKDVSAMSEKDRSEYISQNVKKIEAKKSKLTDGLAEKIRRG